MIIYRGKRQSPGELCSLWLLNFYIRTLSRASVHYRFFYKVEKCIISVPIHKFSLPLETDTKDFLTCLKQSFFYITIHYWLSTQISCKQNALHKIQAQSGDWQVLFFDTQLDFAFVNALQFIQILSLCWRSQSLASSPPCISQLIQNRALSLTSSQLLKETFYQWHCTPQAT